MRDLQQHQIQISMAAVGKPEENGYAERLMSTIKEEEVDLSDYRDFADAERQIGRFIEDVYMTKRIHSSLGYLTPAEFEAAYWSSAAVAATPLGWPKKCPVFWVHHNGFSTFRTHEQLRNFTTSLTS